MTFGQVGALSIAVGLAALDGFDVLAMAFVAPALSHAWRLGKVEVGLLLSSSLVGMAIGSIFLSRIADLLGRKVVVSSGIAVMIAVSSALARRPAGRSGCRVGSRR